MLDNYKKYKEIKMPEDMKNDILVSMQEYKSTGSVYARPKTAIKSRILIYAAMFVSLAMIVVSATAIINNNSTVVQYVPLKGLVESVITEEEEATSAFMIYAAPEVI
jgi:hypothetical protein